MPQGLYTCVPSAWMIICVTSKCQFPLQQRMAHLYRPILLPNRTRIVLSYVALLHRTMSFPAADSTPALVGGPWSVIDQRACRLPQSGLEICKGCLQVAGLLRRASVLLKLDNRRQSYFSLWSLWCLHVRPELWQPPA